MRFFLLALSFLLAILKIKADTCMNFLPIYFRCNYGMCLSIIQKTILILKLFEYLYINKAQH